MIVDVALAASVFKKVKQIRDEYGAKVLKGDAIPMSIESLQWIVEDMYGLTIKKWLVPFEGEFIRGMVERYDTEAIIFVRVDQGPDWLRFTAVKEMAHVFIDEKEDWSVEGVKTLDSVLIEYRLSTGEMAPRETQSEIFAELAAIELLYPYEDRCADLAKGGKRLSVSQIAAHYGLPPAMVARALSSGHHAFATMIWREVGEYKDLTAQWANMEVAEV